MWAALLTGGAAQLSAQAPDEDLRNMTLGEIMGRLNTDDDNPLPLPTARFADQCVGFPFGDNGVDMAAVLAKAEPPAASPRDSTRQLEDYRAIANAAGQASLFAEPAIAVGATADWVDAAEATFGRRSRQFVDAANAHVEQLLATFDYGAARQYSAAALVFECQLSGPDSRSMVPQFDTFAHVTGLIGDSLVQARLLNDLIQRASRLFGPNDPATISVRERHALTLADLNRHDQAENLLRATHDAARASFAEDDPALVNAINNYAFALGINGKLRRAIPLHREVLERSRTRPVTDQSDHRALIGNLAIALIRAGRVEAAEPLIAEEWAILRAMERPTDYDVAVALLNRAELATVQGRHQDAANEQRLAVEIYENILTPDHPVTRRAREQLWRSLLHLGDPNALFIAERTLAMAQTRRAALGLRIDSAFYRERDLASESDLFTLYLDSLWSAGGRDAETIRDKAFPALQNALQSPVNQAFGSSTARRMAAANSPQIGTLMSDREGLSRQWEVAEKERIELLVQRSPDAQRRAAEREQLQRDLARRMASLDAQLRREAPELLQLLNPAPATADQITQTLRADEAVVMVQPGEFGTHVMLVTPGGIRWHRSDWNEERIGAAVQRLLYDAGYSVKVRPSTLEQWAEEGRDELSYDRGLAHELYRELLGPFGAELAETSQLFVTAGGALSSMPFAILVSAPPIEGSDAGAAGLRQTRWLIDDFALATLPSLQALRLSRTGESPAPSPTAKRFVGFGDPVLSGSGASRGALGTIRSGAQPDTAASLSNAAFDDASARLEAVRGLTRLPGTAAELEMLSQVLGGEDGAIFLAERATEPAFRSADLDAQVLVLATHGLIAGELDFLTEPALVMTPPDAISSEDDGLVTVSEIVQLAITANWVVLSACNTASSDGSDGAPGLSGLARAFFYAGAENLLVSHWPVRDDVAARLTIRAIELEETGEAGSRAQALRLAMLELRADTSLDRGDAHLAHPNAWAPFILVGDSGR